MLASVLIDDRPTRPFCSGVRLSLGAQSQMHRGLVAHLSEKNLAA